MKKLLLLGFAAMLLMSCKKDWTCFCYNSNGTKYVKDYIPNRSKSKAKKLCRGDVNLGLVNVSGDSNCDVEEHSGSVIE